MQHFTSITTSTPTTRQKNIVSSSHSNNFESSISDKQVKLGRQGQQGEPLMYMHSPSCTQKGATTLPPAGSGCLRRHKRPDLCQYPSLWAHTLLRPSPLHNRRPHQPPHPLSFPTHLPLSNICNLAIFTLAPAITYSLRADYKMPGRYIM